MGRTLLQLKTEPRIYALARRLEQLPVEMGCIWACVKTSQREWDGAAKLLRAPTVFLSVVSTSRCAARSLGEG